MENARIALGFGRLSQQQIPNHKQHQQSQDAIGGGAEHKGAEGNDERTEKVGKFSEDVKKSKVFVGFVFGDDSAVIGAGERLDAALCHADHHCQHPEFPAFVQLIAKDTDAAVDEDEDADDL